MGDAARNYCFTYNNYPTDLEPLNLIFAEYCTYCIYGREVGESGTPHLQGYFQLKKKERIRGVIGKFPGMHLAVAKGGYQANVEYCSKEGQIFVLGVPSSSGKREGLSEACEIIRAQRPLNEVAQTCPVVYVKYYRGLEALSSALAATRNFKTQVYWYWGSTGTGKSRRCADAEPAGYWKPVTNKWWNGYDGHEAVIVDDYRRDFCTFAELLRLFDRYPYSVETKGGVRPFLAKRLYITTPKSPADTWDGRTAEDIQQLLRRIDFIECFTPQVIVEPGRMPVDELIEIYGEPYRVTKQIT